MSRVRPESQTYSVEEVAAVLGVGATTCYRMIRTNTFPVPVLTIGRKHKISKELVRRYLAGELEERSA